MKVLVLVLITLFLSVPTYAKTYNHEVSKEIVLKGKIVGDLYGTLLSVKYKGRLFTCSQSSTGEVSCYEPDE